MNLPGPDRKKLLEARVVCLRRCANRLRTAMSMARGAPMAGNPFVRNSPTTARLARNIKQRPRENYSMALILLETKRGTYEAELMGLTWR